MMTKARVATSIAVEGWKSRVPSRISPAAAPDLRFMVGDRRVKTSGTTVFDDVSCTRVQNAMRVEVKGILADDGMLAATRIERD